MTWSTSNSKYATVDKNGTVAVNKKAGGKTVTITATAKDGSKKKASIKIKIAKGEVKKIKITGKKTVNAGKTLSLKAKVTATKGANKKLKWTSSNTKYATVSSSGKVKALKAGKKKSVVDHFHVFRVGLHSRPRALVGDVYHDFSANPAEHI